MVVNELEMSHKFSPSGCNLPLLHSSLVGNVGGF